MFSSYIHLVEMLGQGWQVEPPIYVRPRWRSSLRARKDNVYHIVLWRGGQVHLVSVLGCPEIEQFLLDRKLVVDRL